MCPCYIRRVRYLGLIVLFLKACIDDRLDMVKFLVDRNADINRGDNEGWTVRVVLLHRQAGIRNEEGANQS